MADAETGAAPGAAPAAAPDDARPGETRAQASARLRREKREAARKKREKKMREAEYHGKEEEPAAVAEEKRATGAWADDGCGGFPPLLAHRGPPRDSGALPGGDALLILIIM